MVVREEADLAGVEAVESSDGRDLWIGHGGIVER